MSDEYRSENRVADPGSRIEEAGKARLELFGVRPLRNLFQKEQKPHRGHPVGQMHTEKK